MAHWTWDNLRRSLQPYLDYDYDRCLDLILIAAGIRPFPGAEPWKRILLILFRLLRFYQFIMSIAKVGFSARSGNDTLALCMSIAIVVAQVAIYANVYILERYDEVIWQSKDFFNSNFSCSGDSDYDATVRQANARVPGKITLAIFAILCCDQVILLIPNSTRDRIYGIPEQFDVLGTSTARFLQATYVVMFAMFWGGGYFSFPLVVMPLLNGLKRELTIVARSYAMIAGLRQPQSFNDLINATGTSRRQSGSVLMLKIFKPKLEIAIKQHDEVLRTLHLIQPLVSNLYAIIYYSVVFLVSLLVFVVLRSEITFVTLVVLGASCLFVVGECYVWCRMIDSIQEAMEMIAGCVAALGFGLQHSVDNHREYIEIRTSLMIVLINASRRDWFSCGGIFPISVESFGNLCMIIYKFATFLLELD